MTDLSKGPGGLVAVLHNPTTFIERECEDRRLKQKDVALSYALAMRGEALGEPVDWPRVNAAIARRWPKGLVRVKEMAWKLREAAAGAIEERTRQLAERAHDYGLCGGVCPDCRAPSPAAAKPASAPLPERLRTQSDEVQELRGALIAMLWNVVGGDTDESCGGNCEERGRSGSQAGPPFPACAAVRALGWGEHFDARSFEMRASR